MPDLCPNCERSLTNERMSFTVVSCHNPGCSEPYTRQTTPKVQDVVVIHEFVMQDLLEYSTSMPTGVFAGKRWKRRVKDGWLLGEYIDDGARDGTLLTLWTPIEVIPK